MSASTEPPMGTDPRRLLDDPALTSSVRDALEAGSDDLPNEAQLASLATRLGPLLGPGGGSDPGGGAPPPTSAPIVAATASATTKVVVGIVAASSIVAASFGIVSLFSRVPEPQQTAPRPLAPTTAPITAHAPERPAPPEVSAEAVEAPAPIRRPTPRESANENATATPAVSVANPITPAYEPEADPAAELSLIRDAQTALRSSPAQALALADDHRRRFGSGSLAQEREVIAIEALVRLGNTGAAAARASSFRARWPRSAFVRRIDVLVPP